MKNSAKSRSPDPVKAVAERDQLAQGAACGAFGRYLYLVLAAVLLAGVGLGILFARASVRSAGLPQTEGAATARPGPWGKLELVPITIAAPDEILPVKGLEANVTQWLFKGFGRDQLAQYLSGLGLSTSQREELLHPGRLSQSTNGVVARPSEDLLLNLPEAARRDLYHMLCRHRENETQFGVIHTGSLAEYFRGSGVSDKTIGLLKRLSCQQGRHFIFSGWSTLLSAIPSYEEKARLIKTLTRQKTLLIKLHAAPDSDVNALATYWGKACWNTDVKSILTSLKELPQGARVDIMSLLPPFPTSLLYTFPIPQNPLNGPPQRRDCHWTAFNFFRDPPDPRYSDSTYVLQMLQTDHFPVPADPRFGDIVLFLRPDDAEIVHTALFLADDIVFTKNGETPLHPWMFSTIPDLVDQYSFMVPEGQALQVRFYRNKYY